jgi:hypothetical protein
MKASFLSAGVLLLAAMPIAYGGSAPDQSQRSCYRVTIQSDRVNDSDVRQNCERNVSRTVQVGARNRAQTIQTGSINNNKVRQYHFDSSRYFGRTHHD